MTAVSLRLTLASNGYPNLYLHIIFINIIIRRLWPASMSKNNKGENASISKLLHKYLLEKTNT